MKTLFSFTSFLFVLVILVLTSLGFWQLDRAEEKRQIEGLIKLSQRSVPAVAFNTADIMTKEHYDVLLEGSYISSRQLIYDNQTINSNAGYYVLTPFDLKDSLKVILVNRGFVPWGDDRSVAINIDVDENVRTIKAKLIKPVQRMELKEQDLKPKFPSLIQSINLNKLSEIIDHTIIPMIARLDHEEADGFFRRWAPFYGSVDKHIGYAVQWFLMALVLLIIALRLYFKSKK
jgi:surfeit locus 1 family protein